MFTFNSDIIDTVKTSNCIYLLLDNQEIYGLNDLYTTQDKVVFRLVEGKEKEAVITLSTLRKK